MAEMIWTKSDGTVIKETDYMDGNGNHYIMEEVIKEGNAEPTQLDRVEAQATYTAMMTDTLLGE